MLYHYMFPRHPDDARPGPTHGAFASRPLAEGPCPSCTALIDMWEGTMPHFEGLGGNLAVVAKAPIEQVAAFGREKGWKHISLLSAASNSFRRDYGGENSDGKPVPMMTVFRRWPDGANSAALGQRAAVHADRGGTRSEAPGHSRTSVDSVRSDAQRSSRGRRADRVWLLPLRSCAERGRLIADKRSSHFEHIVSGIDLRRRREVLVFAGWQAARGFQVLEP